MAIAHVQTVKVDTSGTSVNFSAITVTAGNTLFIAVRVGGTTTTVAASDGVNTYIHANQTSSGTPYPLNETVTGTGVNDAFIVKSAAGGSTTVNLAVSPTNTIRAFLMEISGLGGASTVQDVGANAAAATNSTATDGVTTGATTTRTVANEILLCFTFNDGGPTINPGTNFTTPTGGAQTTKTAFEYRIVSATGTDAGTFTHTASGPNFIGIISLNAGGAVAIVNNFLSLLGAG